ncbi:MAG: hypothetical protein J6Q29_01150 [Alistipes sp.]|nr:hypothetical protein [Alistipes sp.]
MTYIEIDTPDRLTVLLQRTLHINQHVFLNLDFTALERLVAKNTFSDCIFLGCTLPQELSERLDDSCLILPSISVPYNIYRSALYSPMELYAGYDPAIAESFDECFDSRVYRHYLQQGKTTRNIRISLARSLHDHSISDAMHDFLSSYDERQIVGIMGGHGLLRTDEMYRKIARISKQLTELGYLMISGGGPGAMEATHLGAWFAGRSEEELSEAFPILDTAPTFRDEGWLSTTFEVINRWPQQNFCSLGVPTWLYGHEPATPFATHIAKYFENSIREDGILTIAKGGIIFTPGSAGTLQEIFQDAVQNHYLSFGYASPMVFLGNDYWTNEMPIYPLLNDLSQKGRYRNLILSMADSESEIVVHIRSFSKE